MHFSATLFTKRMISIHTNGCVYQAANVGSLQRKFINDLMKLFRSAQNNSFFLWQTPLSVFSRLSPKFLRINKPPPWIRKRLDHYSIVAMEWVLVCTQGRYFFSNTLSWKQWERDEGICLWINREWLQISVLRSTLTAPFIIRLLLMGSFLSWLSSLTKPTSPEEHNHDLFAVTHSTCAPVGLFKHVGKMFDLLCHLFRAQAIWIFGRKIRLIWTQSRSSYVSPFFVFPKYEQSHLGNLDCASYASDSMSAILSCLLVI